MSCTIWTPTWVRRPTCSYATPQVVRELRDRADACRDDLGDARTGIAGANCRPAGRVANPRTLLPVPEDDLWVRAVYD